MTREIAASLGCIEQMVERKLRSIRGLRAQEQEWSDEHQRRLAG